MNRRLLFLFFFSLFSLYYAAAQDGLFIRLSIGPGYTYEAAKEHASALAIANKNHVVGWNFNDKFGFYVGEFGSLNKMIISDYDYINLDAFGIGFLYRFSENYIAYVTGAFGMVSFAKDWTEPMGDDGGSGYGIAVAIAKEWVFRNNWAFSLGPQCYFIRTVDTEYQFFSTSFNLGISYYFK